MTESMLEESTKTRELAPLQSIRDGFPKNITVRQGNYPPDIDGIRIIHAANFMLVTNSLS